MSAVEPMVAAPVEGSETAEIAPGPGENRGRASEAEAHRLAGALDPLESLLAGDRDPSVFAEPVLAAARELVGARAGRLLIFLPETGRLEDAVDGRGWPADRGLAGAAVAAARAIGAPNPAQEPAYAPEVDGSPASDEPADEGPGTRGTGPFVAVPFVLPVLLAPPDDATDVLIEPEVLGVLLLHRGADRPPFSPGEVRLLEALTGRLAPYLLPFQTARRLEARDHGLSWAGGQHQLYRPEALEAMAERDGGVPLEAAGRWTRWTFPLLVAGLLALVLFASLARVPEWASGPAVIRVDGRSDVTAVIGGILRELPVAPGERVEAGQVLARFYDLQEQAELEGLERELAQRLRQRLMAPEDPETEAALVGLRTRLEMARSRADERTVRAPTAGVVSDLRVRPGQHLAQGQVLLSLSGEGSRADLVALLPGRYRPLLEAGQPLHLEISGYPSSRLETRVSTVDAEVIGPAEAGLALGPAIADAVAVPGPVTLVRASLPAEGFEADGRRHRFHDGMAARAEVAVRSEPLLLRLLPGLRTLLEAWDG